MVIELTAYQIPLWIIKYSFDNVMGMVAVSTQFAEMFMLCDYHPWLIVIVAESNDTGTISKPQLRAGSEDTINDLVTLLTT